MIGRITGNLLEKLPTQVLIEAGGVGYEIEIPLTTYYALADVNEVTSLHTHMVVRDDAHLLFGFATTDERELFRSLIKVNGVGPKLAITILSGVDAEAFANCVHNNDVKALTALPGVGKKTAERLIIEMRDRLPKVSAVSAGVPAATDHLADAETALVNLGFKPAEAARALAQVDDASAGVEELIRQALKNLT